MEQDRDALEAAILALDAKRAVLGDAVVDAALAALRAQRSESRPDIARELKQVTMLFVDAVGSTAMGERLDPEAVHAILGPALVQFTASVTRHRGTVVKYTGDGLLAVFGSGASQEDDVESAVLAGLAILDDAKRWSAQASRSHGVADFDVRAGIHTGIVLLGGSLDGRSDIAGAAVNLAARMEQSAPPGRLRISHDSFRHVRGRFDVEDQAPLAVKGIDQPLRSYLVVRARPRAERRQERGVPGIDAAMVGRDAELATLRAQLDAAIRERQARAVTILAEAGLGKSRLLDEFRHGCEPSRTSVMIARALPRGEMQPLGVLRDLVADALNIVEGEPDELARSKLRTGLTSLSQVGADEVVPVLGQLVGLDFSDDVNVRDLIGDEQRFRARVFAAASRWMRSLAESRTLVVAIDDAHWADDASLDFLGHLMRAAADAPLLVATFARPELLERRPGWSAEAPGQPTVRLAPLDEGTSRLLAVSLLQRLGADPPPELAALIVRASEGSPFAVEELVNLLIDDGVLAGDRDGWHIDRARLVVERLPTTLAGILQARLDALTAEQKRAVQSAAIVGFVFWDVALSAIDPLAVDALPALERKRFVVLRELSSVDGAAEYFFQHHLLHQAAYDTTLRAHRTAGHARACAFWSARADVVDDGPVTAGNLHALSEAQFHGLRSDPGAWVEWFERRFTTYYNALDTRSLRPLADEVAAASERVHGADHPQTAKALTDVARLMIQWREGDASGPLRRALDVQRRRLPADHLDTARTLAVLGGWHASKGEHAEAETHLRASIAIREAALGPEAPLTLGILSHLAKSLLEMGRVEEAETASRRVYDAHLRSRGPDDPSTSFALVALGEAVVKRGDHASAEAMFRQALHAQERTLPPQHPEIGLTFWHLADAMVAQGRHDDAEAPAQRALDLWERHWGIDHEWTAWGGMSLADIRLAQGRWLDAESLAVRTIATLERLTIDPLMLASALALHARILLAQGRQSEAGASAARALDIQSARLPDGDPGLVATRALVEETRRARRR